MPFYTYSNVVQKPFTQSYNPNPATIGEHIRKKRIESRLMQKEVATLLNSSESTVTNWENGRGEPIVSYYPAIIAFLGYYPLNHPVDTAMGLIDRCRYGLGLSYVQLGKRVGVNGSTIIYWRERNVIFNEACKEKLLHLVSTTQCRST